MPACALAMTLENPDQVRLDEIARMREQVRAAVAMRMSGGYHRPVEELHLPDWVNSIIATVLLQFRHMHPEGLPPPPDHTEIVLSYQKRAARLFDDEITRQFALEAS